jgi:hypothetical protein
MTIYIVLLLFILINYFFCMHISLNQKKTKLYFLNIVFITIYLLCVLRSSSVGRDIPGYEQAYLLTGYIAWQDFSYIYYEKGYILLMKICQALGFSFQLFLCVVYAIILMPIYLVIKKYSKNVLLSVLIFVCYMQLEFDLTGIRQALAMSIALVGYIAFIESEKYRILKYLFFVTLALFFHKGAFVCYIFALLLPIKSIKKYTAVMVAAAIGSLIIRNYIFQFIKGFFEKETFRLNAGLYFGGNFIFLLGLAALFLFVQIHQESNEQFAKTNNGQLVNMSQRHNVDDINIKMFLISILLALFFGSETSARSYMFLNQVIILQLPNCIYNFDAKSRLFFNLLFCTFFILFFFTNTLLPNNFDIVPYKFYWQ